MDEAGVLETWEYQGGTFINTVNWGQIGRKKLDEFELNSKEIVRNISVDGNLNCTMYLYIPANTNFVLFIDDSNGVFNSQTITLKFSDGNSTPIQVNQDNKLSVDFDVQSITLIASSGLIAKNGMFTLSISAVKFYTKEEVDKKIENIDTLPDVFGDANNLFDNSYLLNNISQSIFYKSNSYNSGELWSYNNQSLIIKPKSYNRFEFYASDMGINIGETINIAVHCKEKNDDFIISGILQNSSFSSLKSDYKTEGYWFIASVLGQTDNNELRLNFDNRNSENSVSVDRLFIWKGENVNADGLNWKQTFQQLNKIQKVKFYVINYAPYYTSFVRLGSTQNDDIKKDSMQFTASAGNGYQAEIPIEGSIFENKEVYISVNNNGSGGNLLVLYIDSENSEIRRQSLELNQLGLLYLLLDIPDNCKIVRIRLQVVKGTNMQVHVGELFITTFPILNAEYYDIDRQALLSKTNGDDKLSIVYVDAATGSDSNDGTSLKSAVKSFGKALSISKESCSIILNGDISERFNMAGKTCVTLIGVEGKLNRIMNGTFIRSATSIGGNVYQTTLETFPTLGVNVIFQHELADDSTLINSEQRHPLQRGKKYRCDSTTIIQAVSAEAVSSNKFLSYYYEISSNTLTFKIKEGSNLNDNPVVIPSGQSNVYGNDGTIQFSMCNIESWYGNLDLRKCNSARITDCASKYSLAGAGISYDFAVGITLIRCEVCRGRDGINAHSLGDRDTSAKCSVLTAIDCWSHDNYDDGYSDHENGEATIIGGLFEHNVKGGLCPSYGAQDCYYNVTSQYNIEGDNAHVGFFLAGAAETSEGGVGSQVILHNCISIGNDTNYECNSSGLTDESEANTMMLYNCLSVVANNYGYNSSLPSRIIAYDCKDIDSNTPIAGNGITRKNGKTIISL